MERRFRVHKNATTADVIASRHVSSSHALCSCACSCAPAMGRHTHIAWREAWSKGATVTQSPHALRRAALEVGRHRHEEMLCDTMECKRLLTGTLLERSSEGEREREQRRGPGHARVMLQVSSSCHVLSSCRSVDHPMSRCPHNLARRLGPGAAVESASSSRSSAAVAHVWPTLHACRG